MDLSIIVLNYNTNELTTQCIESIYRHCPEELQIEIIVIDNYSQKENPDVIKTQFPKVTLVKNKSNVGFGIANNQGIAMCRGKLILLLNSDTLMLESTLEKCTGFIQSPWAKSKNIGLIGCKVIDEDGNTQNSTFPQHNPWKYFFSSNLVFRHFLDIRTDLNEGFVAGVSGCFMLFKREVFDKIKPFDPDFFMYAEESELCRNRVGKHFGIYYYPKASIIHFGGGSSSNSLKQNMVSYALSRYKNGIMDYLLYLLSTMINVLTLFILSPILFFLRKTKILSQLHCYMVIMPYIFFDIPKHSKEWGGRKGKFLKLF